jgi:hypothetical protein
MTNDSNKTGMVIRPIETRKAMKSVIKYLINCFTALVAFYISKCHKQAQSPIDPTNFFMEEI